LLVETLKNSNKPVATLFDSMQDDSKRRMLGISKINNL